MSLLSNHRVPNQVSGHNSNETGAIELRLEATDGGYNLWLDDKRLHHIENYRIEKTASTPSGPYAELSIKILVCYPAVTESQMRSQASGRGGGAPDPNFSIPCPPRKPKNEAREAEASEDKKDGLREGKELLLKQFKRLAEKSKYMQTAESLAALSEQMVNIYHALRKGE